MKKLIAVLLSVLTLSSFAVFAGACDSRIKISVLQYAEHGSLDNCYDGVVLGLSERGYTDNKVNITLYNAKGNDADNTTYAQTIINAMPAVAVGIATPSAYALANAANGDVSVVFTAVSEPTAATSDFTKFSKVTGSSDKLPVESQLKLITDFFKAKEPQRTEPVKIGILCTKTEANSMSQVAEFEALASEYNVEIVRKEVDNATDIPAAVDAILGNVDCLNNLTDNNVVQNLNILLDKANAANKPVFGSEIEQVTKGCLASCSLDYKELGRQTGYMIADILDGKNADDIEFLYITEGYSVDYNSEVLGKLGFTLPEAYKDANDVK